MKVGKNSWLLSALGQKQTCAAHKAMSAKCQKRTCHNSLDHLVRAPNGRVGDVEAKRLGGLKVDVQLNLCCLLYRQFGG